MAPNQKANKNRRAQRRRQQPPMAQLMGAVRAAAGRPQRRRGPRRAFRGSFAADPLARTRQMRNPGPGSNSGSSGVSATYNLPKNLRNGAVRQDSFDATFIRKCEFVQNITGTAAFTAAAALNINPGLAATFPWLSTVAQSWEKFRFRKLVFHYITRTGNNVPGTVLFAPDYDASDAAPVNEQVASDYADADECPPYANPQTGHYMFPLNVGRMNSVVKEHFVRQGSLSANQDIKLYDPAVANFFTVDGTAVAWGKLWVEYEIDLFTPQLPSGGVAGTGFLVGATAQTAAAPFGTASVATGSYGLNSAAGAVINVSGLSIGTEYLLAVAIQGTVITAVTATSSAMTQRTTLGQSAVNAAATVGSSQQTLVATAASGTITVAVTATTVTGAQLTLTALTPAPSV